MVITKIKKHLRSSKHRDFPHMKAVLKPALENLDKALQRLETAVDRQFVQTKKVKEEPMLALDRNEREVNKKIAARLDQTINRLETLLMEEA